MRSIFLVFEGNITTTLSEFLDEYCASYSGTFPVKQWIVEKSNTPCLYIDNTPLTEDDLCFEDLGVPMLYLQMENPVVWMVNISGNHEGTTEVLELATALLSKFPMYIQDDYTQHYWTLEEITDNVEIEGYKFFDYYGRYKDKFERMIPCKQ